MMKSCRDAHREHEPEIVRLARENPKCLPVSRESNCATAGESTSLVLRVGKPELVMVLLIAFSAQVLSIIGIEWDSSVMIRDA